jgi:hypothetical protein
VAARRVGTHGSKSDSFGRTTSTPYVKYIQNPRLFNSDQFYALQNRLLHTLPIKTKWIML